MSPTHIFGLGTGMDGLPAVALPLLIILMLWSVFWKGLALWHSARRGQPWWFVILLVVNTIGILEIVYLFGVTKLKGNQLFEAPKQNTPPPPPAPGL